MIDTKKVITLNLLLDHFRFCGSEDTAYGEYDEEKYGKLHNHCGCVAYALQKVMGGDILQGKIDGVSHQWNRIDGIEVDLCLEQFGHAGISFPATRKGRKVPKRKNINPRFQKFWDRFEESYYK